MAESAVLLALMILLLVDRLKRRTRDPEVLTLCEYVHGTDVHGTVQGFRRPDVPWTPPARDCIHLVPGVRGTSGGRKLGGGLAIGE